MRGYDLVQRYIVAVLHLGLLQIKFQGTESYESYQSFLEDQTAHHAVYRA